MPSFIIHRPFDIFHRFIRPTRRISLDSLPNDVLVDVVFDYLDVIDIIRLRMVNRLFRDLTHQPIVWKRMLARHKDLRVPPMAPIPGRNRLPHLSGDEVERLLVRAVSLDRNWDRAAPTPHSVWDFRCSHPVSSMVLLPGSQHLVASVHTPSHSEHSVVVYSIENNPPRALTAFPTGNKAYDLTAKYMTVMGEPSLVVAFISRDYHSRRMRHDAEKGRIKPPDVYSTEHKIESIEFRYQCNVVFAPLKNLQQLADIPYPTDTQQYRDFADTLPKPFQNLVSLASRKQLSCPTLADMWGGPYLAVAKGPKHVAFKCLNKGAVATLACSVGSLEHAIRAIRLIPDEHVVLVVREARSREHGKPPIYTFEKFPALPSGKAPYTLERISDAVCKVKPEASIDKFYMPELPHMPNAEEYLAPPPAPRPNSNATAPPEPRPPAPNQPQSQRAPYLPHLPSPELATLGHLQDTPATIPDPLLWAPQATVPKPPRSLVMFARLERTHQIIRIMFEARQQAFTTDHGLEFKTWTYDLDRCVLHSFDWPVLHARTQLLPASHKPLVVGSDRDDVSIAPKITSVHAVVDCAFTLPVVALDGVVTHGALPPPADPDAPYVPEPNPPDPRQCMWLPSVDFGAPEEGEELVGTRADAFAWDETTGRLVVAAHNEGLLRVFEFAGSPVTDERALAREMAERHERDAFDIVVRNGLVIGKRPAGGRLVPTQEPVTGPRVMSLEPGPSKPKRPSRRIRAAPTNE
ncbi:uncharacterized protein BXZ73DRAFT_82372 [Epithele typhae]|uniref:uncharacterized protein n=1 Tax=Epithele typhae TaxID=378194 RepID=UPI002007553B|nr:uncharacterized protein BXZ73DRAFT_82372 [Epithele typhae]KAH9912296.1 hypothetical protein BXZ73DRAFT_82372 [Epithele typhae]